MQDALNAAQLREALASCKLITGLYLVESTSSTNDLTAQLARDGAGSGLLVLAEEQTAGRGRMGRKWEAVPGESLCFSLLLRPGFELAQWPRITTWAAVAIAQGLEDVSGTPALVKWPNDIYFGERKCVGVLAETYIDHGRFAVLGVGVNIAQTEFPEPIADKACSLFQVCGKRISRAEVVAAIMRRLDNSYFLIEHSFSEIVKEADARSFLKGRNVQVEMGGAVISGTAHSLDSEGGLIVLKEDGAFERISTGEVNLSFRR